MKVIENPRSKAEGARVAHPSINRRLFCRLPLTVALGLFIALFQLAAVATESPWQRVVVIGASASGGFVLSEPFGGPETLKCKLHNYLDAALTVPHAPVQNFGTAMLFLSPDAIAMQEVNSATNAHPTLVVAVDFMFWFCYGEQDSDAARAQHFENGLKLLEQFSCPVIVGDIPDASSATNSGIIGSEQVPGESARHAANLRLKQWAAKHPHVTIVPLAEFMRAVKADEAIKLHNAMLPAGQTRSLLQTDGLHPTPRGAAILSLGIWDAYLKSNPKISAKEINWNADEVLQSGLKKIVQ